MKKKSVVVLFLTFILIATNVTIVMAKDNGKKKQEESKGIILVDPGHGGIDGGAKSKDGTIEKEINLSISKKLKKSLEAEGYTVYLTREDDSEISKKKVEDLDARCKMKVDTKCDVFISIHQNKFSNANCFGAQVWYASNEKSSKMANLIQNSIIESVGDGNKRLAKPAQNQYRILRDGYDGACVIVECGFLSNYQEEQKLKTDEHQDKIVNGIKNGVNSYFIDKDK